MLEPTGYEMYFKYTCPECGDDNIRVDLFEAKYENGVPLEHWGKVHILKPVKSVGGISVKFRDASNVNNKGQTTPKPKPAVDNSDARYRASVALKEHGFLPTSIHQMLSQIPHDKAITVQEIIKQALRNYKS